MKIIRIFLASPGDLQEERQIVAEAIEDLQLTIGKTRNVHLELIRWETHAYPDIGDYSQAVINNQIGEYSLLVGIMWQRFGTKTQSAASGTVEEFNLAYKLFEKFRVPKIMFYFKSAKTLRNKYELEQLRSVFDFKEKLQNNGVLYWEFDVVRDFERKLRVHLYHHIEDILSARESGASEPRQGRIFLSHRSVDQGRVSSIYKKLIENGFNAWMAEYDILPGKSWKREIEAAIRESDVFVSFLSKNIDEPSETGFSVDSELSIAESINEFMGEDYSDSSTGNKIHILPVLLDPVPLPESIAELQYLDLTGETDHYEAFIIALRRILESRKKS
jgi:hypothetical protein